jgi:hypothetical protein
MRLVDRSWRVLRGLVLGFAALVIFIEEFGWRPLSEWLARLARWPPLERLEARIRRLPPRVAVVVFLVPALVLFPLKILALAFINDGHAMAGLGVIILAKLLGTALVGRLFVLLEPQLRQFGWFVRTLDWWLTTKARVAAAVRASRTWRRLQCTWRRWRRRLHRTAE